jgi:Di-haem cytochrome c peroxidase
MVSNARARRKVWLGFIPLALLLGATSLGAESLVPDGRDGGPGVRAADALSRLKSQYGRPPVIPFPSDNQYTRQRELLGRTLFFDPRLSASKIVSCATCHNPALSWGDGLPKAVGHGMTQLARRTPTILNLAWAERLFWDGRAESLEEQALGPIEAPGEMNMPLPRAIETLQSIPGYRAMFEAAYPGEGITPRTLGKAIATFERTIVSGMAPFDEWLAGQAAISERRDSRLRPLQHQGGLREVPHGLELHRSQLPRPRHGLGRPRTGSRAQEHRADAARLQDADPAKRRSPSSVHARRLAGHARGRHDLLRPRRRRSPGQPLGRDAPARVVGCRET